MNSKQTLIGLMILALLAISVSGQQIAISPNSQPPMPQQVTLQDDQSGDHLTFSISTGEYKFVSCRENFSTSGIGTVSVTGCTVDLQDISDTKRVLTEVDLCARTGKADVVFFEPSITSQSDPTATEFVISDSQTSDSTFDCQTKTIDPK